MRHQHQFSRVSTTVLVAAVLGAWATAAAAQYTFTKIVETGGAEGFTNLFGASVNDEGTVVFVGGTNGVNAIYTRDRTGTTRTIADSTGSFSFVGGSPAINASGMVIFKATYDDGGRGIFAVPADGSGPVTTLIDTSGPFLSFYNDPSVNDSGLVAFFGTRDDGSRGIYTVTQDRQVSERAAQADYTSSFHNDPGWTTPINNAGQVAFRTVPPNGGMYLSEGDGTAAVRVADSGGSNPDLNNAGQLVARFSGDTFYRYDGSEWDLLTGVPDDAEQSGWPLLNDAGEAAVRLTRFGLGQQLRAGLELETVVLKAGDDLFGKPMVNVLLEDFNNRGQLLFWYGPRSGQVGSGLALATPIPEPAAAAYAAIAASLTLTLGRRRRYYCCHSREHPRTREAMR